MPVSLLFGFNRSGLRRDLVSDDQVSENVLADLHYSVEFRGGRRFGFEVHLNIDAFIAPLHLVRQPTLVPLADVNDFSAGVYNNLAVLVDNGLCLLVVKQRVNDVQRFVISNNCNSPPLGLIGPSSPGAGRKDTAKEVFTASSPYSI